MTIKKNARRRTPEEIAQMSLAQIAIAIHEQHDDTLSSQIPAKTYTLARDLAEKMGLVGPTARKRSTKTLQDCVDRNKPPVFNLETTRYRMEFSEEFCRRLYLQKTGEPTSDGMTLEKLAQKDPAKYERLRQASVSYGIIPNRIVRPAETPKVESDGRFTIAPSLAAQANIPASTRLNMQEFTQLMTLLNPTEPKTGPDVFSTENLAPGLKKTDA